MISSLTDLWVKDKKLRQVQVGDKIRYEGLSATHVRHAMGKLARLSNWMAKNHPNVKDLASMSKDQIEAYLKIIDGYKLTACGWNSYLRLFREMFNRHEPGGRVARVLKEMEFQKREIKHRKPFSDAQLLAILNSAKKDPEIEPLFILGVNTPLRLGDCCNLRWSAVNLDKDVNKRFLRIKTSKTSASVSIPIWDQLYELLSKRPKNGDLVFPELAEFYKTRPTALNDRLNLIFKDAGIPVIERKSGKKQWVNKPKEDSDVKIVPRRVNDSAFHAFRVTWVTRALNAGVPEEIVRKATGHTTVDIVREHYFQPQAEEMRKALDAAKPKFAKDRRKHPVEEVIEVLKTMTAETWKTEQTRAIELLTEILPTH